MPDPVETSELLAFVRVVAAKSVSRAALELGIPRATVSRRLARLEERLGVRLIQRTTRSLSLTEAGTTLYRSAQLALDAIAQAEDSVRRSDTLVRGPLRVSMPPMMDHSLQAAICDFATTHPEVQLQVHFASHYVDLRSGGYHLALRAGTNLEAGLVGRTLLRMPLLAVASPDYLALHGTPKSGRDLRHHRCLLGFARGELPESTWPLLRGGDLRVTGTFVSNALPLLASAAVAGLGIGLLPRQTVANELRSSTLVQVLPKTIGGEARLAIVYVEREFMLPQVRAFIDALVAWAPQFSR